MAESLIGKIGDFLHLHRPWYKLPRLLAMPRLIEIRNQLRRENLYDTEDPPFEKQTPKADPSLRTARTVDGIHNDLDYPRMGCAGARFGRNVPLDHTRPNPATLLEPSPRTVSLELMTRHTFQPVPFLNLLTASWIQFMTHDWFAHRRGTFNNAVEIPLADGDPWPERPMRVPRTPADPPKHAGSSRPPAYANEVTHWWDGSQIYGSDRKTAAKIRTGRDGKIHADVDGKLPLDPETGLDLTGFIDNWWIGLSMLHGLFALEHNAVCDRLKSEHPTWTDEELYGKARMINAALMAKIHTVEWTPAILPHPVIQIAMNTNWRGLAGEDLQDVFEFLDDNEILGGIVGSDTDHHAAPFSMTEEFIAVYRMHPLLPDDYTFRSAKDHSLLAQRTLADINGRKSRAVLDRLSMTDLFYSFGVMHPGAIRLHNYPRHLQSHRRDNGDLFDVASIDILRDRERGVPRYNEFRRLLHKEPVRSFEELTDNPQWAEEIRRVYNNDIDLVDLMVGLYAEPLPEGFGFSETAFRLFVLMASRRLKSDRFFTRDWRPEVYTQTGLDWVRNNSMLTVLQRHYPGLAAALDGVENAFNPWKAAAQPFQAAAGQK